MEELPSDAEDNDAADAGARGKYCKAYTVAMDEARLALTCTAVVVVGDKALAEDVSATLVHARNLLAVMAKENLLVFPLPDPLNYKEVTGLALSFSALEAQCLENCVTADGLLSVMDGLYAVSHFFVGVQAAAQLRPYRARPTAPLKVEEDKANYNWDLARDFAALVGDLTWRYASRDLPAPELPVLKVDEQFLLVVGDQQLLLLVGETSRDAQAFLARLLAKADNGPFPITDMVYQEILAIGKSLVAVESQCMQGYVTADAILSAMDALKAMCTCFAGTAVCAGLHPQAKWRLSGVDDMVSFMWKLASAFAILYVDVKFRCEGGIY